jgi:hypothetical protein
MCESKILRFNRIIIIFTVIKFYRNQKVLQNTTLFSITDSSYKTSWGSHGTSQAQGNYKFSIKKKYEPNHIIIVGKNRSARYWNLE